MQLIVCRNLKPVARGLVDSKNSLPAASVAKRMQTLSGHTLEGWNQPNVNVLGLPLQSALQCAMDPR